MIAHPIDTIMFKKDGKFPLCLHDQVKKANPVSIFF